MFLLVGFLSNRVSDLLVVHLFHLQIEKKELKCYLNISIYSCYTSEYECYASILIIKL